MKHRLLSGLVEADLGMVSRHNADRFLVRVDQHGLVQDQDSIRGLRESVSYLRQDFELNVVHRQDGRVGKKPAEHLLAFAILLDAHQSI